MLLLGLAVTNPRHRTAADATLCLAEERRLKGTQSFGCDVISFSSERARAESVETGKVSPRDVKRYIEMKCRSNRTGSVQLSDNEMIAAKKRNQRYCIYRIYRDVHDYRRLELAILQDPVNSPGRRRKEVIDFGLCAGGGAKWFELTAQKTQTEADGRRQEEGPGGESSLI